MLRWLHFLIFIALAVPVLAVAATGFLDTPDMCLSVSDVKGSAVYMAKTGKCEGKPGRVYVEAQPGESRELIVDGVSVGVRQVRPLEIIDVTGALDRAEKIGKNIVLPENSHAASMGQAAEQSSAYYNSGVFQAQLQAEMARVGGAAVGEQYAAYYKDTGNPQVASGLGADERLYLFISSSMPMSTVRTYVADVAKLKDPRVILVMRGFVGGMEKIMPTVEYITSILQVSPTCQMAPNKRCELHALNVIVDPMLFRRYQVGQVPSAVYVKGVKLSNPDMSEGDQNNATAGEAVSVSGDASLGYIMGKLAEGSGAKTLEKASKILR